MADTVTRTRLRELADLTPERGRVLSVYLNLDPAEFATPPARASQISSLLNDAQRKVDEIDGDLPHDDRMALRQDIDAVRDALEQPGLADEGTRGVAVVAGALPALRRRGRPRPPGAHRRRRLRPVQARRVRAPADRRARGDGRRPRAPAPSLRPGA